MLKIINWPRARAERYHRFLPDEIRSYLKGRGIPATLIERQRLGWDGKRITIPIFGRDREEILGFRYAMPPTDLEGAPQMASDKDVKPQLYGWDTLVRKPLRIVVCEGEFERLVLEANGFAAVTSTGGADCFPEEWVPYFEGVKHVYIAFDRNPESTAAAKKVQSLLPRAHVVKLPADVEERGSITDFFVRLDRTKIDVEVLLAGAAANDDTPADRPPAVREFRPYQKALRNRADRVKRAVPLHKIVEQYTSLQASGAHLVGHCPLHDDSSLAFSVYLETNTYTCSVCRAEGDVVKFLIDKESMTFGQALEALERFEFTHELFGAVS